MKEFKIEEYTGLYRYFMTNKNKTWKPRIRVELK